MKNPSLTKVQLRTIDSCRKNNVSITDATKRVNSLKSTLKSGRTISYYAVRKEYKRTN